MGKSVKIQDTPRRIGLQAPPPRKRVEAQREEDSGTYRQEADQGTEEEVMNPLCVSCGSRLASHETTLADGTDDSKCCECYVRSGNPPADWHPGCVRTKEIMGQEKVMNGKLGPFDMCDEPIKIVNDKRSPQGASDPGDATIGSGGCGDQVVLGMPPPGTKAVLNWDSAPVSLSHNVHLTRGCDGSKIEVPQEKQVDPMWDRYFELAFTQAMTLLSRSDAVFQNDEKRDCGIVEWAGLQADRMVTERERRRK